MSVQDLRVDTTIRLTGNNKLVAAFAQILPPARALKGWPEASKIKARLGRGEVAVARQVLNGVKIESHFVPLGKE
jgi:hypothetical protein